MRWARSSYQSLIVARNSGHMTFLVLLPVSARPPPRPRGYQMIQESLGGPRNTMGPRIRLSRILESSSWKRPADPAPPLPSRVLACSASLSRRRCPGSLPLGPEGAAVDKDAAHGHRARAVAADSAEGCPLPRPHRG